MLDFDAISQARLEAAARSGMLASVPEFPYESATIDEAQIVYVAGPMTGYEAFNYPAFEEATRILRAWGFTVVSPTEIDHGAGHDPVRDGAQSHSAYMSRDLPAVCMADAVVVLDGWEKSTGAKMEAAVGHALGKPVVSFPTLAPVDAPLIVLPAEEEVEVAYRVAERVGMMLPPIVHDDPGDETDALDMPGDEDVFVGVDFGSDHATHVHVRHSPDGVFEIIDEVHRFPAEKLSAYFAISTATEPDDGEFGYADSKATNPKDAIGSDKLPIHLWPETATLYGCLGLLDGMLKYGRSNWREAGVRASIYVDALRRHVAAYFEGEDVDPDSGLPHLAHALACIAILLDAEAAGKLTDDRQFPGGYRATVEALTPHVARLKAKHDGRNPRHFTIADAALDG